MGSDWNFASAPQTGVCLYSHKDPGKPFRYLLGRLEQGVLRRRSMQDMACVERLDHEVCAGHERDGDAGQDRAA